jgi:hypothetical protein
MQDVRVSLALFIGANSGTLFGVPLGSIARAENVWNCLPTIVDDAEITELVVAADVEAPVLRGLDDPDGGTGYLIKAVADALLAMYGRVLPTPPQCLYSINLLVVPLWGLYANILAQLVSQVSSHVVVTIIESRCRLLPNPKKSNCN